LGAAEFVAENAFATRFLERVELQRQILVFARHSGVADQHALNFSLSHQVLDTHLKHDETRTTIQEWFSRIAKPHFWLLCYRGFHVLVKEGLRERIYASSRATGAWNFYAEREETRREHLLELQEHFGFQTFTRAHYRQFASELAALSDQTHQGMLLAGKRSGLKTSDLLVPHYLRIAGRSGWLNACDSVPK
jgi:hypothetical protein